MVMKLHTTAHVSHPGPVGLTLHGCCWYGDETGMTHYTAEVSTLTILD